MDDTASPFGRAANGRAISLHSFAKQTIEHAFNCVRLPDQFRSFHDRTQRKAISATTDPVFGAHTDVLIDYGEELVAVEIFVEERTPLDKINFYVQYNTAAIEIDLSSYHFVEKSLAEWRQAILFTATRYWLVPPKNIRQQMRSDTQQQCKLAEELKQRAHDEWLRLEDARKIAEAALRDARNADSLIQFRCEQVFRAALEMEIRAKRDKERKSMQALQQAMNADRRILADVTAEFNIRDTSPPDLAELVRAHGLYTAIPAAAWQDFDRRMEQWKAALRSGAFSQAS